LADFLVPKLATGRAGSLQLQQGRDASAFAKQRFQERLALPDGSQRTVGMVDGEKEVQQLSSILKAG
jgi:hypothetical protein